MSASLTRRRREEMTRYFTNRLLITIALLFVSAAVFAGPLDEQIAKVFVYPHTLNDQTAYTYIVENKGDYPILGFSVGFDHYTGTSELSGEHPLEVISPEAWESRIISLEETADYEVHWEAIPGTGGLEPGAVKSGFTVVMHNPDPQLLEGHWTAIIDGPPTYVSSQLEVLDGPPEDVAVVPPSISVAVEPSVIWPPNNKMVTVTATVTVSDDQDPAPVVKLESVTCNECDPQTDVQDAEIGTADFQFSVLAARSGQAREGRVYTVVYSATDVAGNRAEASATITVPHDQRSR
jgi:hypothetical protein